MSKLIILTLALIFTKADGKFPNNPKPCEYGDAKCIKDMITFLLEYKTGGYSSLNVVQFDPLHIAAIDIKQGKESPVNIDLKFRNMELSGLKTSKVTGIKGFGKDLTEQHEIHLTTKVLALVGDYKITGKILILPIQGDGRSNITLINTDIGMYLSGTPDVKPDGTTFLKINHTRLTLKPKRVFFNFENLFNGDKILGDNMNLFVNENWQDIFREVHESINNAFSQVFESLVNNVFQKYPYDKFFV